MVILIQKLLFNLNDTRMCSVFIGQQVMYNTPTHRRKYLKIVKLYSNCKLLQVIKTHCSIPALKKWPACSQE